MKLAFPALSLVVLVSAADATEPPNLYDLKQRIIAYRNNGAWDRDIDRVIRQAEAVVRREARKPGRKAIVLDIDETSLSNWPYERKFDFGYDAPSWSQWTASAAAKPVAATLRLYKLARSKGFAVFFITGRREDEREGTAKNLRNAGYDGWDRLALRAEDDHRKSVVPYKAGERAKIAKLGYRIVVNVGDQVSDLAGGYAQTAFKLPNPMYFIP